MRSALTRDQDHAALRVHRLTEMIDGALGNRGAVHAVLQLDDHQTREPQPDERLAQTRPTNSAKSIVRVQARARDRRVAYATGQLPGPAPRRDGHREMPIEAQFIGRVVQTSDSEIIEVRLREIDSEERVVLVDRVER